ncbi:hypothetical protein AAC387_Pa02g1548 [Persea americana]
MSQCVVPSWNLQYQGQEQDGDEGKRYTQVHHQHPSIPMPNCEVTELAWENGSLAMHGHYGLGYTPPKMPIWPQVGGTLESVVHQATHHKRNSRSIDYDPNQENLDSIIASSGGKWAENSCEEVMVQDPSSKRARSEASPRKRELSQGNSVDSTMMTWASFESPGCLTTKTTEEVGSDCPSGPGNPDEEMENKKDTGRSPSTRRSRAAAVHNQSERRRRDRINQKMKALMKLVPNSSKTDKVSMLDEVIEYLKQLQAQLQMMRLRNMPQMMMPLGMQHVPLPLLGRMRMGMGLGMGMGMLDMSNISRNTPQDIPPILHPTPSTPAAAFVPPFMVPHMIPPPHITTHANPDPTTSPFLSQTMNMDLYNNMVALFCQQFDQASGSNSNVTNMGQNK